LQEVTADIFLERNNCVAFILKKKSPGIAPGVSLHPKLLQEGLAGRNNCW
jgi:hypothetical protein